MIDKINKLITKLERINSGLSDVTKVSFRNGVRLMFHPRGFKQFMEAVSNELCLDKNQSKFTSALGTACDITKYLIWSPVAYEIGKNLVDYLMR